MLSLSLLFVVLFSCKKDDLSLPENNSVIIHSSNLVDVRGTSVVTTSNFVERRIDIIDRRNGMTAYSFTMEVATTNPTDDLIGNLKSHTFTGYFLIKYQNRVVKRYEIVKGRNVGVQAQSFTSQDVLFAPLMMQDETEFGCPVSYVHDCVAYKINDMNIVEYLICVASAPGCYAGVWAGCIWDVCIQGKTYLPNASKNL